MDNPYPSEPKANHGELPDPFLRTDGSRVASPKEWAAQADYWRDLIVEMEYGGMPPDPISFRWEVLCHHEISAGESRVFNWSYRITTEGGTDPFSFFVRILFPKGEGPFPAIIEGDRCWGNLKPEVIRRVLESGIALISFNRTELAKDLKDYAWGGGAEKFTRSGGLFDNYPDTTFGTLSAWAWGYQRCVDLLHELSFIDPEKIAATGHSRGGKTALLAGLTDPRITLINDNASCAAGSPVFRYVGDGGETLNILNVFPHWFGQGIRAYLDRVAELPFDQHCLLSAIAPRPLLLSFALDDRWSNPEGMVQSAWAAGEVYRFLGEPDNLAFHLRPGDHSHSLEDWDALLDFIAWRWHGKQPTCAFQQHPYHHLKPAYSWSPPPAAK